MKKKVKQTVENFDLKAFIVKELRRAYKRTPMYRDAKARAKVHFTVKSKHGKDLDRVRFKCAVCGGEFVDKVGAKEIAVDHISPIIRPDVGWTDYNSFIIRLFCSVDNLQVLCNYKGERDGKKSCHKIKTANERKEAAESKKSGKQTIKQ